MIIILKIKYHPEKFKEFPAPRNAEHFRGLVPEIVLQFLGRLSPRNLFKIPEGKSKIKD